MGSGQAPAPLSSQRWNNCVIQNKQFPHIMIVFCCQPSTGCQYALTIRGTTGGQQDVCHLIGGLGKVGGRKRRAPAINAHPPGKRSATPHATQPRAHTTSSHLHKRWDKAYNAGGLEGRHQHGFDCLHGGTATARACTWMKGSAWHSKGAYQYMLLWGRSAAVPVLHRSPRGCQRQRWTPGRCPATRQGAPASPRSS